jgi:hypothetical protein
MGATDVKEQRHADLAVIPRRDVVPWKTMR